MSERTDRHAALRRLVTTEEVESQSRMLDALSERGLEVHQSTLSRDLRELGIRKRGGRYRLQTPAPNRSRTEGSGPHGTPALDDAPGTMPVVYSFTACGPHLITIRSGTGQAQLLGVLLDAQEDSPIAGTIAGDDTVLVVTRGRPEQRAALALLEAWFGEGDRDAS
jgi:transcriptional regulator of arginine metabolism